MPAQPHTATLPRPLETLQLTDIYTVLGTRPQGLTRAEAAARLQCYGRNTIETVETTPRLRKILAHFTHLMALLLWVGGLLGFLAQMPQLGVAIWLVVLINGAFQTPPRHPLRQCIIKPTGSARGKPALGRPRDLPYDRLIDYRM